MEKEINQHKGYIQNTLKSLSNLSQRINHVNKVYNWGLRLHLKEAWLANKNKPEDKLLLKKVKHNNEKIIFLKVKLNISCEAVNRSYIKKKKALSVSQTLEHVFNKNGPISGFTLVVCDVEGYSYAYAILAMHVNSFPHLLPEVKFIERAQKELAVHRKMKEQQDASRSRQVNYNLIKVPEYAFVVDQIALHEQEIQSLIKQKLLLEEKYREEANQKFTTPWPMNDKEYNHLLNLKNRIPLKNCEYQLY